MKRITLRPLSIGGVLIETPLTLAPMAGQTNHAMRQMCRSYGDCGLVCTELLSSMALSSQNAANPTPCSTGSRTSIPLPSSFRR